MRSATSDWQRSLTSNDAGEFRLDSVPAGNYIVEIAVPGFELQQSRVVVTSSNIAELHFALNVAAVKQSLEVRAEPDVVSPTSSTATTMVTREQIARAPGADQSNSLAMITNYVPSAVIVHDQLHVRGGHQFTWLLDGVPVPNTNIASNVGPQFDPKDIDYLEVQRGGLSAEYGDRAYGVMNVVTRSGFERHNQAELVASYGSYNQTNDQLNFGSHTDRFAYYGSLSGNRTDLGLETPTTDVLHATGAGLSGFASLIFNKTPNDQLRSVISVRGDHYQVPNTPEQQDAGIRDIDHERDVFVTVSWLHTAAPGIVFSISPFYHVNRAHYEGGVATPAFVPDILPNDDRRSDYGGGVIALNVDRGRNNARFGFQSFVQRDSRFLSLTSAGSPTLTHGDQVWGALHSFFAEDQLRLTSWLTLNGGLRVTHFSGTVNETATDPRVGAAIRIPRLKWVLRGFYGRYYLAPPLFSVGGPVLELAAGQGFGFLPLKGERDEQHEFGLTIPVKGWSLDFAHFRTGARNFFDHDALGNSNIFFPLTIERARIRGWEASVRSPRLLRRAELHLAYSRQWVQGAGAVTGGLTDFEIPESAGYFYLDHDQRDTLSLGWQVTLPWRSWASANLSYGSGFLDGDGPNHLPSHTTYDLSLGHSFGENWSVQLTGLNLANKRYLLDNSNTFGGTHYAMPRQVSIELRYRFKY